MDRSRGIRKLTLALLPIAALAGAVQTIAATTDQAAPGAAPAPDASGNFFYHRPIKGPPGAEMGLMKVLRQLNLSDSQKEQVHTILAGMHSQMEADRKSELADLPAFGNPGDPQYAAAVQAAQTRASARIRRLSEAQQQIYALLTQQQQAQIPQLLAAMQQRMAEIGSRHGAPDAPK
jgi:Spy/CpxP family protein refolding chaperone